MAGQTVTVELVLHGVGGWSPAAAKGGLVGLCG